VRTAAQAGARALFAAPAAVLKRRANFVWIALKSGVRWLVGINHYVGVLVAVLILAGAVPLRTRRMTGG
jgi:hypothetical protein